MIRQLCAEDLHTAVSIWYSASVKAHNFISEEFWYSQIEDMRDVYLPNSESWVYEVGNRILGFISYYDGFMPALFIAPDVQSQGIGAELLLFLKKRNQRLTLSVYADNERALKFYIREGFIAVKEQDCEHTGHKEIVMRWESEI